MQRAELPGFLQPRPGAPSLAPGQPARGRKRRRRLPPREETTLVCLIKSLVERKVVVELRNDILLRGRLDDVDDFLNMSLSGVTFQTVEGYKREYESIYVKGRNVRFVHLPRSLDPGRAIESYRRKVVETKLEAAKERARALGSAKQEPKGLDAFGEPGGWDWAAEPEGPEGRGCEEGDEGGEGEGEESEGGEEGDGAVAGGGEGRPEEGAMGVRHWDPRAAAEAGGAGGVSGGAGGSGGAPGAGW